MKINDVIGCVGSATLLLFASVWIPILGPFLSLLAPIPFLLYSTKFGPSQGLKIVIITALLVGFLANLTGVTQIIILCIELGLLGLIISETFRRGYTFSLSLIVGTGFMLTVGMVILFYMSMTKQAGPFELIVNFIQGNLKDTVGVYENMGTEQEKALELQQYMKILTNVITQIYPSLMIMGTGFVVWINMLVSKPFFRILGLKYPEFGPLDKWQAPEFMVWGVIGAGFALFFAGGGVKLIAINMLIILLTVYFFHGLSILLFYFNKYSVPTWIRFGIYLLIFIQQFFMIALALGGLFDQWADFRKIHKKRKV